MLMSEVRNLKIPLNIGSHVTGNQYPQTQVSLSVKTTLAGITFLDINVISLVFNIMVTLFIFP